MANIEQCYEIYNDYISNRKLDTIREALTFPVEIYNFPIIQKRSTLRMVIVHPMLMNSEDYQVLLEIGSSNRSKITNDNHHCSV
jgi:hypothetical protein